MMAQKLLPKFFFINRLIHTHGSVVHEFYEHAHFLVFITLSLSVFTSLLRALALDTLRCSKCVYKISCVLARKRIVTRLQAIWSLIYVSFFCIPLVVFVLSKENKSFPNRQKIQCVRSGTHKRKTISMHNGKRILFKAMTMSESAKSITNERWLYVLVHSTNLWLWCILSIAVALFNFGSRRENAQIKMEHIKKRRKVVERLKRGCAAQKSMWAVCRQLFDYLQQLRFSPSSVHC